MEHGTQTLFYLRLYFQSKVLALIVRVDTASKILGTAVLRWDRDHCNQSINKVYARFDFLCFRRLYLLAQTLGSAHLARWHSHAHRSGRCSPQDRR